MYHNQKYNEPYNHVINSPSIPFFFHDTRLGRPCNIYIAGLLPRNTTEYVSINLSNAFNFPRIDIPFHLSIRPYERELVRNSWKHPSGWHREERQLRFGYPLTNGGNFDLMLSVKYDRVSVAINGQHSFDFTYRLDASTINLMEIHGNVLVSSIRFEYF